MLLLQPALAMFSYVSQIMSCKCFKKNDKIFMGDSSLPLFQKMRPLRSFGKIATKRSTIDAILSRTCANIALSLLPSFTTRGV